MAVSLRKKKKTELCRNRSSDSSVFELEPRAWAVAARLLALNADVVFYDWYWALIRTSRAISG